MSRIFRPTITRRAVIAASTALLAASLAWPAVAQDLKLTIGYQTVVEPSKVPQANGDYEKALGATIDWRKFDSGADVIAAIASGAIDIGYVGSSPLAAAASRELPIETIFVVGLIGKSEALVARNGSGIASVRDLAGKKVAVPFVSTTHYSLLAALKHEGVDPKSVQILNLRPPEIAAAWERGDIDAAYVWDPALGQIRTSGEIIVDSAKVAEWGAPTFDAWIVRTEFAEKNPDAVTGFARVTGAAYDDFLKNPSAWNNASENAARISRLTGAKQDDTELLLGGYVFPSLAEQASDKFLGGAITQALTATSQFLKEQERIDAVLPDYGKYVSARYVEQAALSN